MIYVFNKHIQNQGMSLLVHRKYVDYLQVNAVTCPSLILMCINVLAGLAQNVFVKITIIAVNIKSHRMFGDHCELRMCLTDQFNYTVLPDNIQYLHINEYYTVHVTSHGLCFGYYVIVPPVHITHTHTTHMCT